MTADTNRIASGRLLDCGLVQHQHMDDLFRKYFGRLVVVAVVDMSVLIVHAAASRI